MATTNEQAALEIDARIAEAQVFFRGVLFDYVRTMNEGTREEQTHAFLILVGKATDFFNLCERSVADASLLGAHEDKTWFTNKAQTTTAVLELMLEVQATFRDRVTQLGLPRETMNKSSAAFATMQRMVALADPARATDLRRKFLEASLPVDGFDVTEALAPVGMSGDDGVAPLALADELAGLISRCRAFHDSWSVAQDTAVSPRYYSRRDAEKLRAEITRIDVQAMRLIAEHAPDLRDRWPRSVGSGAQDPLAQHTGSVPLGVFADEMAQKLHLLEALAEDLARRPPARAPVQVGGQHLNGINAGRDVIVVTAGGPTDEHGKVSGKQTMENVRARGTAGQWGTPATDQAMTKVSGKEVEQHQHSDQRLSVGKWTARGGIAVIALALIVVVALVLRALLS